MSWVGRDLWFENRAVNVCDLFWFFVPLLRECEATVEKVSQFGTLHNRSEFSR